MSTATISTTRPATADVQWPSRPESTYRILESWSGHLCGSFAQQQDADPHCHTGYGDWKCAHSEVVWHWELDAAADRARTTLNKWGL